MTPDERARAACRGMDTNLFYARYRGDLPSPEAVAACGRCEVRAECLAEALTYSRHDDQGYRGGYTAEERYEIKRRRTYLGQIAGGTTPLFRVKSARKSDVPGTASTAPALAQTPRRSEQ